MVFDLKSDGSGSESHGCTAAESSVADICRACLGRPRLGIDEPIDMAGYSGEVLSSLAQRLADEFEVELRPGLVSGVTTVRELCKRIERIAFADLDSLFGVGGSDEPGSPPHDGPGPPVLTTAHELVEAWAARTPDATALVFHDASLTYAELDAAADHLARRLRSAGVRRGDVVGVLVPRSMLLVTSRPA